jgi:hypothetical protein
MDYLKACAVKCYEKMTVCDKDKRTREEEIMPFKPIFSNSIKGLEET